MLPCKGNKYALLCSTCAHSRLEINNICHEVNQGYRAVKIFQINMDLEVQKWDFRKCECVSVKQKYKILLYKHDSGAVTRSVWVCQAALFKGSFMVPLLSKTALSSSSSHSLYAFLTSPFSSSWWQLLVAGPYTPDPCWSPGGGVCLPFPVWTCQGGPWWPLGASGVENFHWRFGSMFWFA